MKRTLPVAFATALVLGILAVPAQSAPEPQNVVCDNTAATPLTGTYKNVRVNPGDSCYLVDARVTGNLHAREAVTVKVIDTPVEHNIKIVGATRDVVIGNSGCRFDPTVGNNVMVKKSHNVAICWMTVDNNIKVSGNDGRINLHHNRAGNNIDVTNNLAYVARPGDGAHAKIDTLRFRHNTAGNHNKVRNNAGRPVIGGDNTPAITN